MRSASPLFAVRKITGVDASNGRLPDLTAEFEPVPSRHHDVENEKCGTLPFRFHHHRVPGWKHFDGESRAFQMMPHQPRNIRIVLNHKDAWFHTGIVAGSPEYCANCNQIETFQLRPCAGGRPRHRLSGDKSEPPEPHRNAKS